MLELEEANLLLREYEKKLSELSESLWRGLQEKVYYRFRGRNKR